MEEISKIRKVVLREDLLAITEDYKEAIILNQFLYWSERVKDADKLIEQENEIARRCGEIEREPLYGWIYKSAEQMADEILLGLSERQVRRYMSSLVDKGFIQRRTNPKYKWDRTFQYKINLVNIAIALKSKGYPLDDYKIVIPDELTDLQRTPTTDHRTSMTDETETDVRAIPYIINKDYNKDYSKRVYKGFSPSENLSAPTEFNFKIVERQIKSICKEENIINSDEIVDIVRYYYEKYKLRTGTDHPRIKQEQMKSVVNVLVHGTDLIEELDFDSWRILIDKHFDTDYGFTHDWNINLFIEDEIINNRFYETLY